MKQLKFVILLFISLLTLSSTVLAAKEVSLKACTKNKVLAVLTITLSDVFIKYNATLTSNMTKAFEKAASLLSSNDLVEEKGYNEFMSRLGQIEKNSIIEFMGPPMLFRDKSCWR